MGRWENLSLREKADVMNLYMKNGVTSLKQMKEHYNSFAEGGPIRWGNLSEEQKANIKAAARKDAYISDIGVQMLWNSNWSRYYSPDDFPSKFKGFGGGRFGGSGASSSFGEGNDAADTEYVRNTPFEVTEGFGSAYARARKSGATNFMFNGKEYSTEFSEHPKYGKPEYDTSRFNIREVLDKDRRPISDSTRVEPYVGQIPGTHPKTYAEGGELDGGLLPEAVVTARQGIDGNHNYIHFTGGESLSPSLDEFLDSKAREASVNAIYNIQDQKRPIIPSVPSFAARGLIKLGMNEESAIRLLGRSRNPHTCIATTTSQWRDDGVYVPGNVTFDKNRTGFTEVDEWQPGDLLNLYDDKGHPFHSTIITGRNESNGHPLLSYSNGSTAETAMKYNRDNLYDDHNPDTPDFGYGTAGYYKTFRYKGNPEKISQWTDEFNRTFGRR